MESYTVTVNVSAPRGVRVVVDVKVHPAVVSHPVRRRGPVPAVAARLQERRATRVHFRLPLEKSMDAVTRAHLLAAPKASRVRDMSVELAGRSKLSGLEDRLREALESDEDD